MAFNKENYKEIQEKFNKVIAYSQNYNFPINTDELFSLWAKNKFKLKRLLPFFNPANPYIYEYPEPVSFELSKEGKTARLATYIRELWDYPYLQSFLKNNQANFFENRCVESFEAPYGTVRRGMKIVKAFKFFFGPGEEETLKQKRDEVSAILNQNKIEGYFCVSIHPLDYISISDNANNWHTCHSMNSGYRLGNLNYMADSSTVICYVRDKKKEQNINNFPEDVKWNSKKWRVLLFFSKECEFVMAGRQYPSESADALNFFQEIFPIYSPWQNKQINYIPYATGDYKFKDGLIPVGNELKPVHKIYTPKSNTYQYNDILKNSKYRQTVDYAYLVSTNSIFGQSNDSMGLNFSNRLRTHKALFNDNPIVIEPGEEVECLKCGNHSLNIPDLLVCPYCALDNLPEEELDEDYFPYCACCDSRYFYLDGRYDVDFGYLCPNCMNKVFNLKESKKDGSERNISQK